MHGVVRQVHQEIAALEHILGVDSVPLPDGLARTSGYFFSRRAGQHKVLNIAGWVK